MAATLDMSWTEEDGLELERMSGLRRRCIRMGEHSLDFFEMRESGLGLERMDRIGEDGQNWRGWTRMEAERERIGEGGRRWELAGSRMAANENGDCADERLVVLHSPRTWHERQCAPYLNAQQHLLLFASGESEGPNGIFTPPTGACAASPLSRALLDTIR